MIHSLRWFRSSWRGRVRDRRTGRVYQPMTGEAKRHKAEQAVLHFIEELEAQEIRQVMPLTERFDVRFREWLDLKTLRPSTKVDMDCAFEGIFKPAFGEKYLDEIKPKDVERFLKDLETKRKQAAKTRRKHLTTLRGFFTWAVRHKHCTEDPTAGIKAPRGAKRQGVALTVEEARKLVAACRERIVKTVKDWKRGEWLQSWDPPEYLLIAVILAIFTGLRRGNIVNLKWRQVDLGKRKITIPAEEMKANADHVVPIHPELKEVLEGLLGGRKKIPDDEPVLGEKLLAITKSFKAALKRADVRDIRWHDLRHTFATWMSTRCSFAALRQLLGHSPGSVTLQYTHVPFEELQKVVDSLPRLLPEAVGKAAEAASN